MRFAGISFMLRLRRWKMQNHSRTPKTWFTLRLKCCLYLLHLIHQAENLNWFEDKYKKTSGWKYKYTFEKYVWNSVWEILATDTHLLPCLNRDLKCASLEGLTWTRTRLPPLKLTQKFLLQPPPTTSNQSPSSRKLLLPSPHVCQLQPVQGTSWTRQSLLMRCPCCSTLFSLLFLLFLSFFFSPPFYSFPRWEECWTSGPQRSSSLWCQCGAMVSSTTAGPSSVSRLFWWQDYVCLGSLGKFMSIIKLSLIRFLTIIGRRMSWPGTLYIWWL